jgi:hypothetical protein
MEKIGTTIPHNYVTEMKMEEYYAYNDGYKYYNLQSPSNAFYPNYPHKVAYNITLKILPQNNEDLRFIDDLYRNGLSAVKGLDFDKWKMVINAGYNQLPLMLKHKDPEVVQIAYVLSEYFAKRKQIIPDQIVE